MSKQTFIIRDASNTTLAELTLFNYGVNYGHNTARDVAKLLSEGDFSVSRADAEKRKPTVSDFIKEHVGS
jgi:hypothetical protein